MKTYYVYVKGRFDLYALVLTTNDKMRAEIVAEQYLNSTIRTSKMK